MKISLAKVSIMGSSFLKFYSRMIKDYLQNKNKNKLQSQKPRKVIEITKEKSHKMFLWLTAAEIIKFSKT